jgi:hypothetical protein
LDRPPPAFQRALSATGIGRLGEVTLLVKYNVANIFP